MGLLRDHIRGADIEFVVESQRARREISSQMDTSSVGTTEANLFHTPSSKHHDPSWLQMRHFRAQTFSS